MSDWRFVIPVIWAFVSAGLALLLYRTSSGLFEQQIKDEKQGRRIRLVGSIVLAGAIFGALKWATPDSLVTGQPSGSVLLSKKSLSSSRGALQETRNALDKLKACASISPPQECRAEMDILRN